MTLLFFQKRKALFIVHDTMLSCLKIEMVIYEGGCKTLCDFIVEVKQTLLLSGIALLLFSYRISCNWIKQNNPKIK